MQPPDGRLEPLTAKHCTAIRLATHTVNIWEGAVRSGKTVGTFVAWIQFVRNAPPGDLVMVGKTERTLIRNVVRPLQRILGRKRCRLNRGEGELYMFGRLIYLVGANDERSQDKIRGMTLAGAYGDEITIWPQSFWEMLNSRFSVDGAQFFGTTNPDNPNHWLLELLDRCVVWLHHDGTVTTHDDDTDRLDLDIARFSFVIEDNPTLTDRFIRRLKAMYSGVFYKRFILGQWVLADGVIWDAWTDEHVIDDIGPPLDTVIGIDDGTAGTFAAQLMVLTEPGIVVAREFRWNARENQRQLTDAQKVAKVTEWLKAVETGADGNPPIPHVSASTVHVDPSATSLIRQFEIERWAVRKADNRVKDGLSYVASLIATRRLLVHRSCTGLIREIPGYVWDPKAAKLGEDKPVKINDHHCDALRYAVMGVSRWWWDWLTPDP